MRLLLAAIIFVCIWAMVWNAHTKQHNTTTQQTKSIKVSELTPEQLGMLDVGLSLDNLHRPVPKWMAKNIMKHTKKQVQLAHYISKLPAELPKSMKRRRA